LPPKKVSSKSGAVHLLAVLGIAVSVAMGAWGLVLAVRYSRRVRLTYAQENCLSLFADVAQGIDALEVRYNGSPVSTNLVLLRGYIMNSGRRDITPAMVERPLRLTLPAGFSWIDFRITDASQNLKSVVATFSASEVVLGLGLFKTGEYLKFDSLATVPVEDPVADTVSGRDRRRGHGQVLMPCFDYRITDAGCMQTTELYTPPRSFFSGRRAVTFSLAIIIAGLVLTILALTVFRWNQLAYRISDPVAGAVQTTTRVRGQLVQLRAPHGYRRVVTTAQFDSLAKTAVVVKGTAPYGLGLAYSAVGLLLLLFQVPEFRRRRLRRILSDRTGKSRP
jgi:hypothetical protein